MKEDNHWWKTAFEGWQLLMEDKLWWKTTFGGRQPLMEGYLWRKTTFYGRWPLMEDYLWLKTTFDTDNLWQRQPLMEDYNRWKTMENDLWWWPLMLDDLWLKTTFDRILPLQYPLLELLPEEWTYLDLLTYTKMRRREQEDCQGPRKLLIQGR